MLQLREACILFLLTFLPSIHTQVSRSLRQEQLPDLNVFQPLQPLTPNTHAPSSAAPTTVTLADPPMRAPAVPKTSVSPIVNHGSSGPVTLSALPLPSLLRQRDVLNRIAEGSQSFALDLIVRFSSAVTEEHADFIISPFAIWALLLPLFEAADGNTLQELRKTLRLQDDEHVIRDAFRTVKSYLKVETPTVSVASLQAMFTDINEPVNRDFELLMRREYEADLFQIDFQKPTLAADLINEEVRKATKDLIPHAVLPQDLKDAKLVLMTSLYFKGQWKSQFNATQTRNEPFFDEAGQHIGNVDMMMQMGNFNYTGMNDIEAFVLEMPYGKEDRLSMFILLPKRGVALKKVAENLQKVGIQQVLTKLAKDSVGFEYEEVEVNMPRFTTESDFAMNSILYEMGIKDLFDDHYANLTKMGNDLFVSRIMHKTKIIVDEEGTTAAAVASAVLTNKASPPKFILNRPFMYLIIEKTTNSLLFCGHIMNPNRVKYNATKTTS